MNKRKNKVMIKQLPSMINSRYFVSATQAIRYMFNKKDSQLEATLISLILSELFSLRYVQPKAILNNGVFSASISDISFYTGIDDTIVTKCLKRLICSGMIDTDFNYESYTKDNYHTQYFFMIYDDVVNKFAEIGEARFLTAKSEHFKVKTETNMNKMNLTLNCDDLEDYNF